MTALLVLSQLPSHIPSTGFGAGATGAGATGAGFTGAGITTGVGSTGTGDGVGVSLQPTIMNVASATASAVSFIGLLPHR